MPDSASAAWRSDQQLQQLGAAWRTARANSPTRSGGQSEALALRSYMDQNRQRLGIPAGYYWAPGENGGGLVKSTDWTQLALTGAAAVATAATLGAALPAIGAAAGTGAGTTAAAAGTAATIAGAGTGAVTAGVTGASLASRWLAPILNYGLPAVTGLISERMQSNASRDASQIQNDYLNRALDQEKEEQQYRRTYDENQRDYSRGQYADYLGRLKPYGEAGNAALGRAQGLVQQPMITVVAPDGSTAQRPASEREHWINKGGQVQA